jgi:hypothetical protein
MAQAYANVTGLPSTFWGAPVLRWNSNAPRWDGLQSGELYCPGFEGATFSKRVNDYALIGGIAQTPGTCVVSGNKSRALDKKKASGSDGSRLTFHGIENAEGEMTITIWTPEQLRVMQELIPLIFPPTQKVTKTTKTTEITAIEAVQSTVAATQFQSKISITKKTQLAIPQAFDVSHPYWSDIAVKSVIFTSMAGRVPTGTNMRAFTFKWIEFLQPGKNTVTKSVDAAQAKTSTLEPSSNPPPGQNPANTAP